MPAPESSDPDPTAAGSSGRVLLGRFRVEKVLGRGGMGEVLLAHDTLLQRRVALKHLHTDGAQGADRRGALLKEARRASQVSDRRIAAIHDVLDLGDDVLLVMEYVDGQTLRERLREPFPLETFWELSGQCVGALGAAHAKGVIHRDIKPENLMLTREHEIKILDFGIALRSDPASGAVTPGGTTHTIEGNRGPAGTPQYMAPEAHYGGRIDERTDIFSLGAVFYEMLTARHPFAGGAYESLLDQIMNSVPAPANQVNPAVPLALSLVVDKMLARDPAQRYASCEEVAGALAAARAEAPGALSSATSAGSMPAARSVPGARRLLRSVVLALAVLALAVAGFFTWRTLAAPRLPNNRNLALLLPATPGANRDFSAFALGSIELLAARLQRHQDQPSFQMSTFQESLDDKVGSAEDARKLMGANLALVSTLELTATALRARLELREPVRGRLVGARSIDVPLSAPQVFMDSLYSKTVSLLGLPQRGARARYDPGVRGAGTMRFLAQGMGRSHLAETDADLKLARDDLETACRAEPDAAAPHVRLAAAELRTARRTKAPVWLDRAEASARKAVALDSSRAECHRVLGEILGYRKSYVESLAEYQRACELDPTDDDAWYRHGRTHQRLGDAAAERAVYVAASERRPSSYRPRWWLGSWEAKQGHIEAATQCFVEMIRRAPELATGYASLGGLLVLQGEYDRAIDTLHFAVSLRPMDAAFSNLGTAYFNTGRLTESVDAYNQAIQFGSAGYVMWLNLGDAYFWLRGRPDQSREAYLQALRLARAEMQSRAEQGASFDPMIPASLSSMFPKLGQPDSARIYLRLALAADSANAMVQYSAALTLWQLGDHARALTWLERAVSGGYPTAWLRDSPVHRDWRAEPRFTALLASASPASRTTPSPEAGGRR